MKQEKTQTQPSPSKLSVVIFWILSIGTALFTCVAFFYWTVVPYMQSSQYLTDLRESMATGNYASLINDDFIFNPDSNVEGILRNDFLRQATGYYQQNGSSKSTELIDKAIYEMEDYLQNHPSYYTYILSLADGYSLKSEITNNPQYFATSEMYFKKDLSLVSNRQDIIYLYAIGLLQHGKQYEALKIMRNLVAANPDVITIHYEMANVLMFFNNPVYYDEAFAEYDYTFNALGSSPDWIAGNGPRLKAAYQIFLKYFYTKNDFNSFYKVVTKLSVLDPEQKNIYANILAYMDASNKMPVLNINSGN